MLQFSYGFSYFQNIFNQFYHILALCFFRKTFENFIFNVVYFSLVWVILKLNIAFDYTVFGLFWPSFLLCHYLFKVDTFRTDSKKIRYTYTTQFIFHHDKKFFFSKSENFVEFIISTAKNFFIFLQMTWQNLLGSEMYDETVSMDATLFFDIILPKSRHYPSWHTIFAEYLLSVPSALQFWGHPRNI